jgi:hypothetical protein
MIKETKIVKNKIRRRYGLKSGVPDLILDAYLRTSEIFCDHKKTVRFIPDSGQPKPIGDGFLSTSTIKLWELDFKELKTKNPGGYSADIKETPTCYIITEKVINP